MLRLATLEDIPQIVALGEMFVTEAGFSEVLGYCRDSAANTVSGLLASDSGCIYLLVQDGEAVGMAGGILAPHFFNANHRTGQELFWYVHPNHRGRREALRLIEALETWAKGAGAQSFVLASAHSSNPAVARMYRARGYQPTETYYIRRL